jgi:hypothetical protein
MNFKVVIVMLSLVLGGCVTSAQQQAVARQGAADYMAVCANAAKGMLNEFAQFMTIQECGKTSRAMLAQRPDNTALKIGGSILMTALKVWGVTEVSSDLFNFASDAVTNAGGNVTQSIGNDGFIGDGNDGFTATAEPFFPPMEPVAPVEPEVPDVPEVAE